MRDPTPDSLLPLPTAVFHILIALAGRDRHGYSIMQDVAARTERKVQLSAGTLYSSIRRMLEQGLIEELPESPDPSSTDERRRYYRLTRFGKRVAAAEVARLTALVNQARETGLVPGVGCAPKLSTRCSFTAIRRHSGMSTEIRWPCCSPNNWAKLGGPEASCKPR